MQVRKVSVYYLRHSAGNIPFVDYICPEFNLIGTIFKMTLVLAEFCLWKKTKDREYKYKMKNWTKLGWKEAEYYKNMKFSKSFWLAKCFFEK